MAKKAKEQVSNKKTDQKATNKKAIINIPVMSFEDVMSLAEGIWECASGKKVRRITLFDHLGKSPESSPSRTLVTSSSKYGLTNGSYKAEYLELTELGSTASNPESSSKGSAEAKFKLAIESNKYFNHLYETYKNMKED